MDIEKIKKSDFQFMFQQNIKSFFRKTIASASDEELYLGLAYTIRDFMMDRWLATHKTYEQQKAKQVYYLSMEFLPGPLLGNYLLRMGLYDMVEEVLEKMGISLKKIEETEPDPGLGNGGLGRLAACFLDSLSTLEYPAYGCGIRYRYGILNESRWIPDRKSGSMVKVWKSLGSKKGEYAVEVKFNGEVKTTVDEQGKYCFYSSQLSICTCYSL